MRSIRKNHSILFIAFWAVLFLFSLSVSTQAADINVKISKNCQLITNYGTKITLKAIASGGSGRYSYRFNYYYKNKWYMIQNYSSKNTCTFTPPKAGNYFVYASVLDSKKNYKYNRTLLHVEAKRSATDLAARKKVLSIAKSWLGSARYSTGHYQMVNIYNKITNNRYRVVNGKYQYKHCNVDIEFPWCDIYVSAVFSRAGLTKLINAEYAPQYHLTYLKSIGRFAENDNYIPYPGDLIFFDWQDDGAGDCTGWADHIGIVYSVSPDGTITTIEGNHNRNTGYRTIKYNSRYIRGYGLPKYSSL